MSQIYMTHPAHGAMFVASNYEAEIHEKHGWVRGEWKKKEALKADIDDLESLRLKAQELGVDVDRRWGEGRLIKEIEARSDSGD